VYLEIESTLPFTEITLTNTGCSSGWVLVCTESSAVNAGADDLTTTVCGGSVVLEDLLSIDATVGGTWSETSGSGAFDEITTIFDADLAGTGTYTFEYSVDGCETSDLAMFSVTVVAGAGAGTDSTISLCNNLGTTVDLNTLLSGGADLGGTWTETTTSGSFDPLTGVFDVSDLPPGDYTFTYMVAGIAPCPYDEADFTVTVNGFDALITSDPVSGEVCEGGTVTLTGSGAGVGGIYVWDMGITDGVAFSPPIGTTTYTLTATDDNGCIDMQTMDITSVEPVNAGDDNITSICGDPGATIDLNTLLIGADAGGTWTEAVITGVFDPLTGIFDIGGLAAGDYSFTYTLTGTVPCPDDAANFVITVNGLPAIVGISDPASGEVCTGMATLTGSGAGISGTYTWDMGVVDGVAFTPPVGATTYTVTGTDVNGCTNIATVDIVTVDPANAGADNNMAICNDPGATVDLNTLLIGADADGVWAEITGSGSFDPLTGIFNVDGLPAGDYTFTYTVASIPPCPDDLANFTITVNTLAFLDIISDPTSASLCEGSPITLTGTGAGIESVYTWDLGVTDGTSFIPPLGTTTYTLSAVDINGCSNTTSIDVTSNPIPVPEFIGDQLTGCDNLNVRFDNLTILEGETCTWEFGDGISGIGCDFVVHTFLSPGIFDVSLTVETAAGCQATITYDDYISISPNPVADFSFTPNLVSIENIEVTFINNSVNGSTYEWDFGDGSSTSSEFEPIHDFPATPNGRYNVELTVWSNDICIDTTSRTVIVQDIVIFYIPNVFTPDGDDFNETFTPVITSGIDIFGYHLTIFNRYGEVLFESFDPNVGWRGTYGDRDRAQEEIYIWQIEFGDTRSDEKQKHRGHVTLLY